MWENATLVGVLDLNGVKGGKNPIKDGSMNPSLAMRVLKEPQQNILTGEWRSRQGVVLGVGVARRNIIKRTSLELLLETIFFFAKRADSQLGICFIISR